MGLEAYRQKRDFTKTPEPKGRIRRGRGRNRFVCQEHHASSLHFDFRLEIGGVLKSWSIRKGPSMNPQARRLAVPTEDHPVEYLDFEGTIPAGEYGAGEHRIWDAGEFRLLEGERAEDEFEKGKLKFELRGRKLNGAFSFFRLGARDAWLLVKSKDEHADDSWRLELLLPDADGKKFIEETEKKPAGRSRRPGPGRSADEKVVKLPARPASGETLPTAAAALKSKNLKADRRVRVGEYALELTNLGKLYWSEEGYTKGDLIRYYEEISEHVLPYLAGRPLIMKRYPNGIRGHAFHQHDVDEVPEFVRTVALVAEDGGAHAVDYIVGGGLATDLYMANLGAIERHPWHARVESLDRPDWFVFDLDPGADVAFDAICDVALSARDIIGELGLESYAKTSGSRGLHVYVPVRAEYAFERVADLAARIARRVARANPARATVERSKNKRRATQIYVDHLQNAYGKSVVAPYSVRPKPGATVSAPLAWEEIEQKKIALRDFTIETMPERVKQKGELFAPVLTNRQSLEEAFEKIAARPPKRGAAR